MAKVNVRRLHLVAAPLFTLLFLGITIYGSTLYYDHFARDYRRDFEAHHASEMGQSYQDAVNAKERQCREARIQFDKTHSPWKTRADGSQYLQVPDKPIEAPFCDTSVEGYEATAADINKAFDPLILPWSLVLIPTCVLLGIFSSLLLTQGVPTGIDQLLGTGRKTKNWFTEPDHE